MNKYPQVTLRELMLGVLFIGLGCAGLLTGGVMASIFLGGAFIVTIGFAIVALVGRDELRATAIGFLVPVIAYAASIIAVGSPELDPYGNLPTTKLIRPAFELIVRQEWINPTTGQPMPAYDPTTAPMGPSGPTFNGLPVHIRETPDRTAFMSVAHALLAMLFGYAGSKFAVFVYRKHRPPVHGADTEALPG